MKINFKISYFYQIRNFKPNQLPVSTALWDPKWYHENKDQNHIFVDKNGVLNGLRIPELSPIQASGCGECTDKNPEVCQFMKQYKEQLENTDFYEIIYKLTDYAKKYLRWAIEGDIILIVHEAPTNPCSERAALQEYFDRFGYDLPEFRKDDNNEC